MEKKYHICITIGILLTCLFALIAISMGQFSISVIDVWKVLLHQTVAVKNAETVIFNVRIPRILLSLFAGSGLAVAGAAFQSLFSNPLATPDTLGCANGASFGAALGILVGLKSIGVQMSALFMGILAVILVFVVSRSTQRESSNMMMVILSGMVVSSLFSALVSFVKYVSDPNDVLPVITFWLMGSFSSATLRSLYTGVPFILIGILVIYLMRYRLNALTISEDEARSFGINLKWNRFVVIAAASMITAAIVSLCGVIGWVGLLIPHICRMLFGNNQSKVIPGCIVFGAMFMLGVDTLARCMCQSEIPVSILTSIIGAPVFIILLRKTGGIHV